MKIEIKKLSKKLKDLREQKKLTQEELANNLGVSRQSIIALEQGKCLPSLPLAISFLELFELPFEQIFCEEIENMHQEMNQIINSNLFPVDIVNQNENHLLFESTQKNKAYPPVEIKQLNSEIIIYAELPGVNERDIEIEISKERLTISGKRNDPASRDQNVFSQSEIKYGSFSRIIPLPSIINEKKAKAILKNGILQVNLPIREKSEPKIIKIKIK